MRALSLYVLLTTVLLSPSLGAQTLALTEPEALARLDPNSPHVQALRAGVDIARAAQLAAGRWPNPRVTFNRESVAGATENMVLVAQPLPITGRRGLDVEAAAARVAAVGARADDLTRRLRADLRLAFAAVWLAQTRERELARVHEQVQELAAVLARREAAGDAAGFDCLRAEREAFDLEADRALTATELSRAQAALAGLFASPVDPAAVVAVRPDVDRAMVPPLEMLMTRAEASRGELLALERDAEAARLATRAADRRRVPEPEVVAGTKSSSVLGGDVGSVIAVQATIPLFDRARPERALAVAQAAEADARAEAFRLVLRAQVAALRAAVLERRAAVDRYRTAAAASDDVERIARISYDAGERSILELLDAYRTAADARIREAALDAAAWEAAIELEYVSGWEMSS